MKNSILLIVFFLTSQLGCIFDDGSKENMALKSKLQGNWMWEEQWEQEENGALYNKFRRIELYFDQSVMSWKDITITYPDILNNDGYVNLKQGKNNVFYFYNNGESPITYGSALTHFFEQRATNDILWVDNGKYYDAYYTIEAYNALEDSYQPQLTGRAGHTIRSSSIIFSNNDIKAEFCDASLSMSPTCRVFEKMD